MFALSFSKMEDNRQIFEWYDTKHIEVQKIYKD